MPLRVGQKHIRDYPSPSGGRRPIGLGTIAIGGLGSGKGGQGIIKDRPHLVTGDQDACNAAS